MARTSNLLRAVALAGLFVSALAHANSAVEPVPRDKEETRKTGG
jgi:hypothetical protein